MAKYYVSCPTMTIQVDVIDGKIVKAAPIAKKFVGQPFNNLLNWLEKIGNKFVQIQEI